MTNVITDPCYALTCREFVELVTHYLEGTLTASMHICFEAHLDACPGCQIYVEQMQQTINDLGKLSEETISETGKAKLLACFLDWKRTLPTSLP